MATTVFLKRHHFPKLKNEEQYVFFDGDYPAKLVYDGVEYFFSHEEPKWGVYFSKNGVRMTFTKREIWVNELNEIARLRTKERHAREKAKKEAKEKAEAQEKSESNKANKTSMKASKK